EPEVIETELEVEAEPEPEVAETEVVEPEVEAEIAEFVTEPEQAAEVEPAAEIEPVAETIIEEALEVFAELASANDDTEPAVEQAETAHESRATAANAARLLSQFSEESATPPAAEPEPEPEPEAPPAAPEGHAPRPRRENGFADTAALLRELSSLGTETSALSPAPRMPAGRPPAQP